MAKGRAESINARDLTGKLRTAVQSALKSNASFASAEAKISFFPGPGIIGFILRDLDLKFSDVNKLAMDVTAKLPDFAEKSRSAVIMQNGGVIVGFFPIAESIALPE